MDAVLAPPLLAQQATGGEGSDALAGAGGAAGQAGQNGSGGSGGTAGTVAVPNGGAGLSGGGGGGGYSFTYSGDVTSGATGGNGGAGAYSAATNKAGGGGGGGDAARIDASTSVTVSGTVRGGRGGAGGDVSASRGGGGGGGGAGVVMERAFGLTVLDATVSGGAGGGSGGSDGGGGGGAGVILEQGGGLAINNSTVSGGIGGPSSQIFNVYLSGSAGTAVLFKQAGQLSLDSTSVVAGGTSVILGSGGAGVSMAAGGTITNAGVIRGGEVASPSTATVGNFRVGGTGSGGAPGGTNGSSTGYGGIGITGSGLTVVNSGTIEGGEGYGGRNYAVRFTGGTNILDLRAGSVITGRVLAEGTNDTLRLGGDANGTFDLSQIGPQYQNFELFEKTGASTWTVTGTTGVDWSVAAGTLALSGDGSFTGAVDLTGTTSVFDISGADGERAIGNLTGVAQSKIQLGTNTLIVGSSGVSSFDGNIEGTTGGLSKQGGGTFTLFGSSIYTGETTVTEGTLKAGAADRFASQSTHSIGASGTLDLGGYDQTIGALEGDAGSRVTNSGASGTARLTAGANNASTGFAGVIADGADATTALTKAGTGTLTLSGANTYTGSTIVSGGTLALTGSLASTAISTSAGATLSSDGGGFNSGTVITNLGTLALTGGGDETVPAVSGAGAVQLSSGSVLTLTAGVSSISGVVSGAGGLNIVGTSATTLSAENTYSGGTVLSGVTLSVGHERALGQGAVNLSDAAARLLLNNRAVEVHGLTGVAGAEIDIGSAGTLGLLADSGTFDYRGSIIGGTSTLLPALVKGGDASQRLSGINDFTGLVAVMEGTLVLGNDQALSATNFVTLASGAELHVDGVDVTIAQLYGSAGSVTLDGGSLTMEGAAATNRFGGIISGSGAIEVNATGQVLTLTGANDYTGGTRVTLGRLNIGNSGTTGSIVGNVEIGSNGTLAFQRTNDMSFTGAFSGDGAIVKRLANTLELTGDSSGFAGSTLVEAGRLSVNGTLGGGVTVSAGGRLGGSGTIGGNTVVSGTLAAGNSPGTLVFASDLTLNAGSTTVFELGMPGVVGGTDNDFIEVQGTLTLGGAMEANVAAAGYYQLFSYGALASGSGFASTSVTGANGFGVVNSALSYGGGTDSVVTLSVLGAGQQMQFWDGTDFTGDGTVGGGSGTWNAGSSNWTGAPGDADINGLWLGSVGVFMGTAGTVTVDGTQSFDTLQFKTDGYVLSGGTLALAPAAGSTGTLSVDTAVTVTIGSAIVDGGAASGLNKIGGGTLILSGANSYSGGTTISAGTLQISADDNLGAAAGGLSLNGGTLATTASFALARNITLDANGAFDVASGTTLVLNGTIGGTGGLIKVGNGTLMLSGVNDFVGGTTFGSGMIQVSSDANLGDGAGELTFAGGMLSTTASFASGRTVVAAGNGGFDVASGTTLALTGDVSGAGVLAKIGDGELVLSGSSSVEWNVQAGAVTADAASFTGDLFVATGAGFTFNQSMDASYAGTLSGAGGFTKTGGAALNYTGNGAAFSGLTRVAAGRLAVNGTLSGPVDVLSGATLGGNGTIGPVTLADGAIIAPGNSAGTLVVTGDISFAPGSTYQAELAGNGSSDLIIASGQAFLNGAGLALVALDPEVSYRNGQSYVILDTAGGVVGSFGRVTTDSVFLTARTSEQNGEVVVSITVTDDGPNPPTPPAPPVVFPTVAITANQFATASALDTLAQSGAPLALYNAILFLPSAQAARNAFDQLSGEVHASSQSVFMEQSSLIRGALTDRLRAAQGGVGASATPVVTYEGGSSALGYAAPSPVQMATDAAMPVKAVAAPANTEKFALWTTGFGNWGEFDGNGNAAGVTDSTGGFLIGADTTVWDGWRLGVAGGYSYSDFSIAGRNSSGNSDNWHVGVYGGKVWAPLALRTGLAYTWQDVTTARSAAFTGFADSLNADYDVGTFQSFGELGWRIDTALAAFEPFANLAYVNLDGGGYFEQGGAAALFSDGADMDTTFATLGLRASREFVLGSYNATLRGAIGWRHAFGDITPAISQAFVSSDAFTVAGVPIAEDAAVLEAGFDVRVGAGTTLGVAYSGQFGESVTQNGFNATLKVSF